MSKLLCVVCEQPVPDPIGKHIPHKKYCSQECTSWQSNQNLRTRRKQAYDLFRYMENRTPVALKRLLKTMEEERKTQNDLLYDRFRNLSSHK